MADRTRSPLSADLDLARVRERVSKSRQFAMTLCLEVIPEDVLRFALRMIEAGKGKLVPLIDPKTKQPVIDHETGKPKMIRLGGQNQDAHWRGQVWNDRHELREDLAPTADLRLSPDLEAMRTDPKTTDEDFIAAFLGVDLETLKRQMRRRAKKQRKSQPETTTQPKTKKRRHQPKTKRRR
jgi:hypothetical protein